MDVLILGFGEVGQGVYQAIKKYHDVDYYDSVAGKSVNLKDKYDILLVCFPYSEGFVDSVNEYQNIYDANAVIIFSTVPIGTTSQIKNAVHSPVEGKHPYLASSMGKFRRFVGGYNGHAIKFFIEAGFEYKCFPKPETTELLKLQSTTNYGINIEYAREVKKTCDKYSIDYEAVKEYNRAYNKLYEGTNYKRYILDPPDGKIGGHCILSNIPLFKKDFDNGFIKILEDNNARY